MESLTEYSIDFTAGKKIIEENFKNWTSGNESIDNFIRKKQLKYEKYYKVVFEWIPYNKFIEVEEIGDNCLTTAIWKEGPLRYDENAWIRASYEKVVLRPLYDPQKFIDEFMDQDKEIEFTHSCRGLSQNPDTKVYILVLIGSYFDHYCEKCGNRYDNKWCLCQINHLKNNFTNWTSGNEKIDDFIQEKQLEYDGYGVVFEWIPYNEFINIKEIGDDCLATAIWKNGPSIYNPHKKKLIKVSYKVVCLKFLHNSLDITNQFLSEVESYLRIGEGKHYEGYGLSQNPVTKVYVLVFSDKYFEKYCDKCGNEYIEKYTIWKDGPLIYNSSKKKLIKESCKSICLKYLHNSPYIIDEFLNEVESYLKHDDGYGLSQNPDTRDYILVFDDKYENKEWLKNNFTNWTSGNKKIDSFIQEKQLKYDGKGVVFEWIPYDELIRIKEMGDNCLTIAIWKDGPLIYNSNKKKLIKKSCVAVCLKYLFNSLNDTNEFLKEVESYLKHDDGYGLSQNPDTKVYILVFDNEYFDNNCVKCGNKGYKGMCNPCQMNYLKNNLTNRASGIVKIDSFIQEQLKYNRNGVAFEWIQYNEFINIKEIDRENGLAIATWKDGPLYYSKTERNHKRKISEKVLLKYIQNIDSLLNEIDTNEGYGISQNPNIKYFILVLQLKYYCEYCGKRYNNQFEIGNKSCILCQTNHENKKIDDLIREMKLSIDYSSNKTNIIFEWIPYKQFNNIEEIGKGGFSTVHSAIWKDGLLYPRWNGWRRKPNIKVALKCLHNSQNFLDEFINEVKAYSHKQIGNILKIYGISQNPETKDYIMVLEYAEEDIYYDYYDCSDTDDDNDDNNDDYDACISDMGLCRKIDDADETSVYGVMPYVAPEVLKGNPYTQAADIYSFGMIMYVIATGKQPFANRAHDGILAASICNGIRPEIDDQIAPKCYIDLMKKCWDSNPENRPLTIELEETIELFHNSLDQKFEEKKQQHYKIEEQFKKTQVNRTNFLQNKNNQITTQFTHPQAIYTSRLLNPYTVEITDFTNL
ncbi:kinase-like domain-containing protein [Rhizophagus clarus]|uniref:Kinase-like domain-containing protein n=1 Tax=Rhizophagus clarus TaxID=94130 RepID=A0A8H3QZM9_9GLOM|nr:kinase-like domain-containing protein [Rhizophagus clarus]